MNGPETLQGTANLWHILPKVLLPILSIKLIIPGICAYWNVVKSGSNRVTSVRNTYIDSITYAG